MGDFTPDRLDSRSLETLWEWKNRVLLEEYYMFNVAIPLEVGFCRNRHAPWKTHMVQDHLTRLYSRKKVREIGEKVVLPGISPPPVLVVMQ